MGKRIVTTEVQRVEEGEVYFCDDCGGPHAEGDLNPYRNGADVLHFCDDCEQRFEETRAAVTGKVDPTLLGAVDTLDETAEYFWEKVPGRDSWAWVPTMLALAGVVVFGASPGAGIVFAIWAICSYYARKKRFG